MLLVFTRTLGTPVDTQAQPQVLEQLWLSDSLSPRFLICDTGYMLHCDTLYMSVFRMPPMWC